MKRIFFTLAAGLACTAFAGCAPMKSPSSKIMVATTQKQGTPVAASTVPVTGELVIPGTGDSQDLLRLIAQVYQKAHPNTKVVIPDSTGSFATKPGTLGGLESAGTRTTPLGRTAVRPREIDLKKYGPMFYREFARVPVAFVVHKSVSVRALTSQQVCDIYAGRIQNWKELGGADLPLVVQTRPEGSNMLAVRESMACFKDLEVTKKGHYNLRNADAVTSLQTMAGSIGFMPVSEADHYKFTMLKLDGRYPFVEGYPVTISLGLVHMDPLSGLAKDFADFLSAAEAQKILRETGHLPIVAQSELVK
ncbi:MAG: substrate-binding domain-containing protein [Candidatus Binatia bacterium]